MASTSSCTPLWLILLGFVGVLLLASMLTPSEPSMELARTTHEALAMARDARNDWHSAVIWSERWRLLGTVVGVCVPLIVAYLIWNSSLKHPPDTMEIVDLTDRYLLTSGKTDDTLAPESRRSAALQDGIVSSSADEQ